MYAPLNIFVGLVDVIVWTTENKIRDSGPILHDFVEYRTEKIPNSNSSNVFVVYVCRGVKSEYFNEGSVCKPGFAAAGMCEDYSENSVARRIAYYLARSFGIKADTPRCHADGKKYIMHPADFSSKPIGWSKCSLREWDWVIRTNMFPCVRNAPKALFESPECGNGIVERGEECDCGHHDVCQNWCCDPHTCKLDHHASCASGKCCDLSTCRPHLAGTLCRDAASECDFPEHCDGVSKYCPEDAYKQNAEPCQNGGAFCYNGTCPSRSAQCKLLWGLSAQSEEECYEMNKGNCGYDPSTRAYNNCSQDSLYCGRLHCSHVSYHFLAGKHYCEIDNISVRDNLECKTATFDFKYDTLDPGLAPEGSKCGVEKVCLQQKCVSVIEDDAAKCPSNCSGNGVCDNRGQCRCNRGFYPPSCTGPSNHGRTILFNSIIFLPIFLFPFVYFLYLDFLILQQCVSYCLPSSYSLLPWLCC